MSPKHSGIFLRIRLAAVALASCLASAGHASAQTFADIDAFYELEGDLAFSEVHAAATGDDPNGFFEFLPEGTVEAREICAVNTFVMLGALNTVLLLEVVKDKPLPDQLKDWNPNLYRLVLKKCDVGIGPGEQSLLKQFFSLAGRMPHEGAPLIDGVNTRIRAAFTTVPPWLQ
ncbi:MAG: hypothetical protein AAF577_05690 [Pseudomonadota bacterium]